MPGAGGSYAADGVWRVIKASREDNGRSASR